MPQTFIKHLLRDLLNFCVSCNTKIRLIKAEPYKGSTFLILVPLSNQKSSSTLSLQILSVWKVRWALALSLHLPLSPFSVCAATLLSCGSSNMLLPHVICLCCTFYLQCSSLHLTCVPVPFYHGTLTLSRVALTTSALSLCQESPLDMSSLPVLLSGTPNRV